MFSDVATQLGVDERVVNIPTGWLSSLLIDI